VPQKSFTNIFDTLILDVLRLIKLITLQQSNMKLFSLITLLVCAPASSAKFGVIKPLQKLKANSPSVRDPFEERQSLAQTQSNALLSIRGGALGVTQDNALTGTFVVA
jgi:hypothetical protein